MTLLLADAGFTVWAGFMVLAGSLEQWRGTFLLQFATAHLLLAIFFLVRRGDRHPFGLIVAATGLASLTMAVPVQFGGPPVPIAWAAEGVALAWIAVVRRHPYSASLAALMAVLAIGHLVLLEYPLDRLPLAGIGAGFTRTVPFVGPEGFTWAFVTGALAVTAILVPIAWVRAGLGLTAGLLAVYILGFELTGPALVGGWAALAAAGLSTWARVVEPRIAAGFRETRVSALALPRLFELTVDATVRGLSAAARPVFLAVSLLAGAAAVAYLVAAEYPGDAINEGFIQPAPFWGLPALAFGLVLAAIGASLVFVRAWWARVLLAAVAWLLAIWAFPFELSDASLVGGWAALAAAGLVLEARVLVPRAGPTILPDSTWWVRQYSRPALMLAALLAGVLAITHLIVVEYPIDQIRAGFAAGTPFLDMPALAFGLGLAFMGAIAFLVPSAAVRAGLAALALLLTAYVLPFELSGPALVGGWAALAAAGFVGEALIERYVGPAYTTAVILRPLRPAVRAAAAVAGGLMIGHLVWLDFPLDRLGSFEVTGSPYAGAEGLSLALALVALAVAGFAMGNRWFRLGLVGIGATLLVYSVTFEVATPWVAAAWGIIAVASVVVVRVVAPVDLTAIRFVRPLDELTIRLPFAAAGLGLAFLAVEAIHLAPPEVFAGAVAGNGALAGTPFLDDRTFVLGVSAATLVAIGLAWRGRMPAAYGAIAAAVPFYWLLPFEVRPGYAVAGWAALGLAALAILRFVPAARIELGSAAAVLLGSAAAVALGVVARPDRLVVVESRTIEGWSLWTDATVALAGLTVAFVAGGWLHRRERQVLWLELAGGLAGVYLLSVAVVDQFQLQVGSGLQTLEELQFGAQVGLSVLWSILGAVGFAAGLSSHRPHVRLFGLGLLAVATVKVFLVDLANLEVAYRVLSLMALGGLLLISAAAYARVQHPSSTPRHTGHT